MRARAIGTLALAAIAGSAAACILVTGGTDGYERAPGDGGADGGGGDAALSFACASEADCAGDGGVCCLVITSRASAAARCQAGPCDERVGAQLCRASAECAGEACVAQRCALSGVTVSLQACGALATCTAE